MKHNASPKHKITQPASIAARARARAQSAFAGLVLLTACAVHGQSEHSTVKMTANGGMSISQDPGSGVVTVRWPDGAGAMLESAPTPTGPWIPLGAVRSPAHFPAAAGHQYFRLQPAQIGEIAIIADELVVIARPGIDMKAMDSLVGPYGFEFLEPLGDGRFWGRLKEPLNRAGLRELADTIRFEQPNLVAQVGIVVQPGNAEEPLLMTDEVVVQFREDAKPEDIEAIHKAVGAKVLFENPYQINQVLIGLLPGGGQDGLEASAWYMQHAAVEYAEPNYIVSVDYRDTFPNDPLFANQWHLHNTGQSGGTVDADIDAPAAWDITRGSASVIIGVVDNGFDSAHPDLAPNLWVNPGEIAGNGRDDDGNGFVDDVNGWDFFRNDNTLQNDDPASPFPAHGTSAAGCAAARGFNLLGVTGSCPLGRLMLVRQGSTFLSHGLAIDYAWANGAHVISCSWGYPIGTPATRVVTSAMSRAAVLGRGGLGSVVLFAMNNLNVNDCTGATPDISSHPLVIGVSRATNLDRFDNSGFGNCMDVLGPTRNSNPGFGTLGITTTDIQGAAGSAAGDYRNNFNGTSAATPITAGIVGLMLDVNSTLPWWRMQWLLQDTADKVEDSLGRYALTTGYSAPPGGNATHGFGRVNAFEAVRLAAPASRGGKGGVDIFLRDNRLDWGNTEQPSNVLFESARGFIPHWQSVDIKVDAPPFRLVPPATSMEFDAFPDENPVAEAVNKVYVRVHNRGPVTAAEVRVKLHWVFAGTALPALPPDFWTRFPSDSTDTSRWHPMGTVRLTGLRYSGASVAGGSGDRSQIATFDFAAPALDPSSPAPRHHCLLAVIDSPQDRVSPVATGSRVPDYITPRDNNVTHKNVQLQDPASRSVIERFYVRNPWPFEVLTRIRVETPQEWSVKVRPEESGKPFVMKADAEHLFEIEILNPNEGQAGTVTVIQEAVGANIDPVMGGFTFEFGPVKADTK